MNPDKHPAFTPESKYRILSMIKESLNTTFVICNMDFEIFGKEEFTDIFNQILPTAIVLNTGYWPFYQFSDNKHQQLCVCQQFMIPCLHKLSERSSFHEIHLPPERSLRKFSQDNGVVRPYRYFVQILETLPQLPPGYSLSFRIVLRTVTDNGRSGLVETEFFEINERYTLLQQFEKREIFNYDFLGNLSLKKAFDNVLGSIEWFHFDQRITTGFTIKSNEVQTWTLCAANALDNRMRNDLIFLSNKKIVTVKKNKKKKASVNVKLVRSKSDTDVKDDNSNTTRDTLLKFHGMLKLISHDDGSESDKENSSRNSELIKKSTREISS